jgi:hypothetical protein
VILSTQGKPFRPEYPLAAYLTTSAEPTVIPPVLLDLCPVVIAHRFSSPAWWDHLRKHVSAKVSEEEGFDAVVRLDVRSLAFTRSWRSF